VSLWEYPRIFNITINPCPIANELAFLFAIVKVLTHVNCIRLGKFAEFGHVPLWCGRYCDA